MRARTAVHHDEQVVGEPYRTEQVEVERIPLDCWVEAPIPARQEDDATIITRPEEVVVVGKRLKAAEEVRLRLSCCAPVRPADRDRHRPAGAPCRPARGGVEGSVLLMWT